MKVQQLLMIPDPEQPDRSLSIARRYACGFEYNDFYTPAFLDDNEQVDRRITFYSAKKSCGADTMHGAFLDVTVFSDDPHMIRVSDERVVQSLEIARRLGVRAVIFHTNFIPNFHTESYCRNWIERNEVYWAKKLEEYPDVDIYMENMFDMTCGLLTQLAQRLSGYSNFGVCFDYAHAHAFGDSSQIENWVQNLAPYVKHIHINDNDLYDDLHLALGDGSIDWKQFKYYYETYFSQASVLVEVKDLDAAERSLEYLLQL